MAHIQIYQMPLSNDVEFPAWTFMPYAWACDHCFDTDIYECVYEYDDDNANLEHIFEIFNIAHPDDYMGRSLSVSDIVAVDGIAYYVDSFGFERLEDVVMPY